MMKNNYKTIIKSQCKTLFPSDKNYNVDYTFFFKKNPLDASNTTAMLKLIEDILFENDSYKVIHRISTQSIKDKNERVEINVEEI